MELKVWEEEVGDRVCICFYEWYQGESVRPVTIRENGMYLGEPLPNNSVVPPTFKLRKKDAIRLANALIELNQ